jgi:toxin ParE1/3/4
VKIRFSTSAFHHLEHIHAYMARDNRDAASETIDKILRSIDKLGEHPQLGRPGAREGTRELVHPPFLIVYRIMGDALVSVEAVLHGSRRYPAG